MPPAPVWLAERTPSRAPGSSISATNASVPISSSWYFAASDSSSTVIAPGTGVMPRRSAKPASSALLIASDARARVPSSSFRVTTRCAAESSARLASFASGTLSAATMSAGFMSTSTVPW